MTSKAFEKGRLAARQTIALMKRTGANVQGQAIAWFRREDWSRWQAIDPMLEPDYEYWLGRSEGALAEFQAHGIPVVKIMVDPGEFLAWRAVNPGGPEASARAHYAAAKAREMDGKA